MTEAELVAIERRVEAATEDDDATLGVVCDDATALVAEVRRLRGLIEAAEWASYDRVADYSCPWCQAAKEAGGWDGPRSPGQHEPDCPAFPPI